MPDQAMASDTSAPVASIEDRVFEKLFGSEEPPAEPEAQQDEAPQGDEPSAEADDELALMDDPESTQDAPAPADELEIVYNGESMKVPKSEAKDLAQLGMHFKKNTERFEQQWKSVESYAQAVQQQIQVAPEVQEAHSLVTLYQRAIEGVDLAALRQMWDYDPAKAGAQTAEYHALVQQRDKADAALKSAQQKWQQASQYQAAQWAQRQEEVLKSAIPQWRDPAKRAADETAINSAMRELGYTAQEIDGVKDARAKHLMHLATKYLTLQKAKGEQLKKANAAPPVAKPGVASTTRSTAAERDAKLAQAIKSTKNPAEKARLIQARLAARL